MLIVIWLLTNAHGDSHKFDSVTIPRQIHRNFGAAQICNKMTSVDNILIVFSKIDEGNFGKIHLAHKIGKADDGTTYVVKSVGLGLNGDYSNQRRICQNELDMFKLVQNASFFVQLKYACKTAHAYNFVMDHIPAGNLFNYLHSEKLTADQAKICCAEIVLAIQYLHEKHVVYRDLKLENILIDTDGHLLLTDFGLSRQLRENEKLDDVAGTLAYFAPEMLRGNRGHSFEVDWWAVGIVLFELLMEYSPFLRSKNETPSEALMCDRILFEDPYLRCLQIHERNQDSLCDFVSKLLIKDPEQRLGSGRNGFEEVKKHAYFSPLHWSAVKHKSYKCLKENLPPKYVEIQFENERIIPLNPPDKNRKDFYFVSSELMDKPKSDAFLGFVDEDIDEIGANIDFPEPMYNVELKKHFFVYSDLKTITELITKQPASQATQPASQANQPAGPSLDQPGPSGVSQPKRKAKC